MSAGRLAALAPVGIVAAIVAGASLGRALAPDGAAPAAQAVVMPAAAPNPALRPVLGRLDRVRLRGRTALRRAETPDGQAAAARRLAGAHAHAAAQLAAPPSTRLAATARAYGALAAAARTGSRTRYTDARRAVSAAEADLARAVDAARRPPPARPPTQASTPPSDPTSAPLLLVMLGFAATTLIGLFVGNTTALRPDQDDRSSNRIPSPPEPTPARRRLRRVQRAS